MLTKSNYNVQILVDGKPVKEYTKDGKVFVEAKTGTEYSVRIKNNSGKRSVAIVSIDGINTITGEIAKPDSTGYVIQAFSSIEVKGYRQDTEGGGRFKFTEKESGYSKEIDGTGINSGVIGVLFYQEKQSLPVIRVGKFTPEPDPEPFDQWPYERPWQRPKPIVPYWGDHLYRTTCGGSNDAGLSGSVLRSSNLSNSVGGVDTGSMNFCSSLDSGPSDEVRSATTKFDAATTWGTKFTESLEYVDFVRDDITQETHNLYYASRAALKEMGVIKETPPQISFPQSFPKFAKPPSNWKS